MAKKNKYRFLECLKESLSKGFFSIFTPNDVFRYNGGIFLKSRFLRGMSHGIPICLGYLSVSFGLGILAVNKAGLSVFQASVISALNLTSAGQKAGIDVIAASGSIIEMILLQLTINIRYSLMALSLSQNWTSALLLHTGYSPHMVLPMKSSRYAQLKKNH